MKINKIYIVAVLFFAILMSACVSSKKYTTAIDQRDILDEKVTDLKSEITKLENEQDSLQKEISYIQSQSNEQLAQKQNELEMKEKELQQREQILADMKDALNLQHNAVVNLKKQVCDALKCYTPDELNIEVRNGKLYVSMSDKLLFTSGSDKVNERGKEAIQMLSDVLVNSDMEIMVEGHTDSIPISNQRNMDNWDLSVHRATSVTRLLTDNGIEPGRIIASGRSKYHPLASNNEEIGRKINRRTDVVLAPKLDKLWELTENDENMDEFYSNQYLINEYK